MPTANVRRVGAYAKLLANYASDDAIMEAGEAAELLFVRGLAFLATSDSDGFITDAQVRRYVGAGMRDANRRAARLVEVGVWQKVDGGYHVRSWLRIHESAEEKGRRRKADRERKTKPTDSEPTSERIPAGIQTEAVPESLSLIHDSADTETGTEKTSSSQPRKRGERLVDDWTPSQVEIDWQRANNIPDALARRELPKFRDYWVAQPGQRGVKSDWPATWRNWLRTAQEREPSPDFVQQRIQQRRDPLGSAR